MQDEVLCDVCEINADELHHSGVGPVSYSRCSTCEEHDAESIEVLCYTLYTQGGPETISQNAYLANWWPIKRSFHNN